MGLKNGVNRSRAMISSIDDVNGRKVRWLNKGRYWPSKKLM